MSFETDPISNNDCHADFLYLQLQKLQNKKSKNFLNDSNNYLMIGSELDNLPNQDDCENLPIYDNMQENVIHHNQPTKDW